MSNIKLARNTQKDIICIVLVKMYMLFHECGIAEKHCNKKFRSGVLALPQIQLLPTTTGSCSLALPIKNTYK